MESRKLSKNEIPKIKYEGRYRRDRPSVVREVLDRIDAMEVSECFFVNEDDWKIPHRIASYLSSYYKKKEKSFSTRSAQINNEKGTIIFRKK